MKGNKGITLIALVITIIVLLILAGVSIAMLSGENSLLGRAKGSVSTNEIAEGKDQVALAWNSAYASYLDKYYTGKLGTDTLTTLFQAELTKIPADAKFTAKLESTTVTVTSKSDTSVTATATLTITNPASGTTAASSGKLVWN